MEIVALRPEHEAALREFLEDFATAGEEDVPAYFADPTWSIEQIVARLDAWSRGERLAEGWVPCTTSFLLDEGRILGVVNLRHALTAALRVVGGHVGYSVRPSARGRGHGTRLLEAAKEQARALGLERLLVTCEEGNVGSRLVIERCGGAYVDTVEGEPFGRIRRHWILL